MSVITSEEIKGGKPVIKGSRVTVEAIVERFYHLDRSAEKIAEDLDISVEEVEEALRYHHSQIEDRAEMEA